MSRVAEQTPVDVFVMGPHVDATAPNPSPAAGLRAALIERLGAEGFSVPADLADVIAIVRGTLGSTDLATTEHEYAKLVDLLIFIPSSNGSAAEIGYFAGIDINPAENIARRSLILLDESHQTAPGFVALGPAALLTSQGARLSWVNYSDVEQVWVLVKDEVRNARARKARATAVWIPA